MFDNLTRYFSRRGTDKTDIATSSAAIADLGGFEDDEPKEYVEHDIDAVSLDAPALDDLIISDESSLFEGEGIVSDDTIAALDDNDDDFQEI